MEQIEFKNQVMNDCIIQVVKDFSPYHHVSCVIANLVVEKQEAYGDSFSKSGQIMKILYPEGVPLDKLEDALTVIRIIDKLFRIATKKDAFGESPWKDIVGYALLAAAKSAENRL